MGFKKGLLVSKHDFKASDDFPILPIEIALSCF